MPYWGGCYYWCGDYYYWGGLRYLPAYGRFAAPPAYSSRFGYASSSQNPGSSAIFFPPIPPPVGAAKPPQKPPVARIAAPADLANYVYEPFYAPLSTRLADQDLTGKLITRLENFRTKRSALQTELQQKLDALKDASPTDRVQQLERFAGEQTPRIVELEKEAEQLRGDLLRGGLVGVVSGTGDWNESRQWKLGDGPLSKPRDQTLVYEFLVMRAAVFYQEGLSPEQRRLLREIAMELQVEAFKPASADQQPQEEKLLYFSPETARIRIPDDLPAGLSAEIDAYQAEKSRLKGELRDTLYKYDAASESKRAQVLRQLAAQQAPAFVTLEALADAIRARLAVLAKPSGPVAAPPFPPELSARISAYHKEKQAVQKKFQADLEEIRNSFAPHASRVKMNPDATNNRIYQLEIDNSVSDRNVQAIRAAIGKLNEQNTERLAALAREQETIRNEVAHFSATQPDSDGAKSIQTLLDSFFAALHEEESWQSYQNYRVAAYQPGLSPEQRRLLFEVALEKLALPLPDAER